MVGQFRVVNSGLDFIIVIIIMSNFLVILGCSDDDSVSLSSPTVQVVSVSVSPAKLLFIRTNKTVQLHKIQTINDIHLVVRLL